jgi:hypothetical protein
MIERIEEYELKFDKILELNKEMNSLINDYKKYLKYVDEINKYYGSKEWFEDLKAYDSGKIIKVKAGVLSEDGIWNMDDDLKEISQDLKKLSSKLDIIN